MHRQRLLEQRAFRIDQLHRLDISLDTSPDAKADPARAEIDATLREAAHWSWLGSTRRCAGSSRAATGTARDVAT